MKRNYVYLFILIILFKGYFNGADKENSNEVPVNDKEIFQELKESNSIGRKHETEVKEYFTKQNTFNHYTEDNEDNQEYLNHNNAQSWFNNTETENNEANLISYLDSELPACPNRANGQPWNDCFGKDSNSDGGFYLGEWKNDTWHGKGSFTFSDGEAESGIYVNGELINPSTETFSNGDQLLDNGDYTTFGTFTYENGDEYTGGFKLGKRHGEGTYIFVGGDKYVGEWRDDQKQGKGIYIFENNEKFEGIFEKNAMKLGKYTYIDGSIYEGEFVNKMRNGQGTYTYIDGTNYGDKYSGNWLDDKTSGLGTYIFANGDIYIGNFKDNQKHGTGTYRYVNGFKYEGEWQYGKRLKGGSLIDQTKENTNYIQNEISAPKKFNPVSSSVNIKSSGPGYIKTAPNIESDFVIQLATVRSDEAAKSFWEDVNVKYKNLIKSDLYHDIKIVDLGHKGIYYRLRVAGFKNKEMADTLCDKLKELNQACFVTYQ